MRGRAWFVGDFKETACVVWCADDEFGGDDGKAMEESSVVKSCVYERWSGA